MHHDASHLALSLSLEADRVDKQSALHYVLSLSLSNYLASVAHACPCTNIQAAAFDKTVFMLGSTYWISP